MPLKVEDANATLTKEFPGVSASLRNDYAKIVAYLSVDGFVVMMKNKWGNLLSSLTKIEMEELESRHGFEAEIKPITGLIKTAEDFFDLFIRNGKAHPFNDTGAPADSHGPYTHRIQWCLLMKAVDKNALDLSNNIKTLYCNLADRNCEGETYHLWDYLVDANKEVPRPYAARSPEHIWDKDDGILKTLNPSLRTAMR